MTLQELRDSLRSDEPPEHLSLALAGLWWDAKGDWTRAHESAQQDEGPSGAWVHARRENPFPSRLSSLDAKLIHGRGMGRGPNQSMGKIKLS